MFTPEILCFQITIYLSYNGLYPGQAERLSNPNFEYLCGMCDYERKTNQLAK